MKTSSLLLAAGSLLAAAQLSAAPLSRETRDQIEAGRHIVEEIALCADCHTPRNQSGQLDQAHALQGAPLGFKPLMDMPWAPAAPSIAGLVDRDPAAVMHLLMTGTRPDGTAPLPPMPTYRLSKNEAKAVVVYLHSLRAATQP